MIIRLTAVPPITFDIQYGSIYIHKSGRCYCLSEDSLFKNSTISNCTIIFNGFVDDYSVYGYVYFSISIINNKLYLYVEYIESTTISEINKELNEAISIYLNEI